MQKAVVKTVLQNTWSAAELNSSWGRENKSSGQDCSEEMQWEHHLLLSLLLQFFPNQTYTAGKKVHFPCIYPLQALEIFRNFC